MWQALVYVTMAKDHVTLAMREITEESNNSKNADDLSQPSSHANFSKLCTPAKVMLKAKLHKALHTERQLIVWLNPALSIMKEKETFALDLDDEAANSP